MKTAGMIASLVSFYKKILWVFLERGEGREKERESNIDWLSPTGDLAYQPGMCPDWKWNHQPFNAQASAQSTEPHQPGLFSVLIWERQASFPYSLFLGENVSLINGPQNARLRSSTTQIHLQPSLKFNNLIGIKYP